MSVDQQFTRITEKLQALLRNMQRLEKENEKLREQLVTAQQLQAATEEQVKVLQNQASILKLAGGDMPEKEKKAFERTINKYIRDIDRCIAHLDNQSLE